MTKTRYLYAVASDGGVVKTRTWRPYTHALIVKHNGEWFRWSFHSNPELARKAMVGARALRPDAQLELVEVTEVKP